MRVPYPANEFARQRDLDSYRITDTEPEESFDRIVRLAGAMTEMPVAMISLVDNERQWFKASQGIAHRETPREHSLCAHAICGDEVMVVENAREDPRFADNPLVTEDGGIRFYAGAPLKSPRGNNLGTLCVIDRVPRRMDKRAQDLLRDMAALVVSELELRKAAGMDGLTQLFNRRFIDELAQREFSRARRAHIPFTAALLDIDKFKAINDTFGHAVGDNVLRAVAQSLTNSLRDHDLLGRYGGEEFVLLMPGVSQQQAMPILERVRRNVSTLAVPDLTDRRRLTISIGAAEMERADLNVGSILLRADRALYRAKESGRDRVEAAA